MILQKRMTKGKGEVERKSSVKRIDMIGQWKSGERLKENKQIPWFKNPKYLKKAVTGCERDTHKIIKKKGLNMVK